MPVKWKSTSRFKPGVILRRIEKIRTIKPDGGASFSGLEIEDLLPALHSMLDFPTSAADADVSSIVWQGLVSVGQELNPDTFLVAINKELSRRLATKETAYVLLTSISIEKTDIQAKQNIFGTELKFPGRNYPRIYNSRNKLLKSHATPTKETPSEYCKVTIKVRAKSPIAATNKALHALDIQRALWCMMGNPQMQIAFGNPSLDPINVIRLGSQHTLHLSTGVPAADAIWFEPGFTEAKIFRFSNPDIVNKNSNWAHKQISVSQYGEKIALSLVRYVRAFDERDPNSAFLGLWSALEALTTPHHADYEKTVRRCSFLFKDSTFHRQMLEHLREYRNVYVHTGEASDRARTHCYQLQLYFVNLIWFHIRNAKFFKTLDEANYFLDSPNDLTSLKRKVEMARKAIKFIS